MFPSGQLGVSCNTLVDGEPSTNNNIHVDPPHICRPRVSLGDKMVRETGVHAYTHVNLPCFLPYRQYSTWLTRKTNTLYLAPSSLRAICLHPVYQAPTEQTVGAPLSKTLLKIVMPRALVV